MTLSSFFNITLNYHFMLLIRKGWLLLTVEAVDVSILLWGVFL
jgi:hypothetical protein